MLAKAPVPAPRFSISTLDVEDEHIWLTMTDGSEWVGRMLLTPAGKQRFEIFQGGRRYEKIPHQRVSLWRPIDQRKWLYELPEVTATLTKEIERPRAAPILSPEVDFEDDGHIPPGLHIGRAGEPPETVEEVKIRLIRTIRTRNVLEREVTPVETLWLPQWVAGIKVLQEQYRSRKALLKKRGSDANPEMRGWRPEDHDDYYADGALDALPARFTPEHRDVSDYEANTDKIWLELIWPKDRGLFHCRAQIPPLSWWALADAERLDESAIKDRYRGALERLFQKVKAR
jgi:hypothetical protein